MGGKWVYILHDTGHVCKLPIFKKGKYSQNSIWQCDCGLQYIVDSSFHLVPVVCGKTTCKPDIFYETYEQI